MRQVNIAVHAVYRAPKTLFGEDACHYLARGALGVMSLAAIAITIDVTPASAQSTSSRGDRPMVVAPPRPVEPRVLVPAEPHRGARLRDAAIGQRALQLTPAQGRAMAAVRDRYSPTIKAGIARLNALLQQQATAQTMKATEDTLRGIIGTERATLDSLIRPDQRQRFNEAMRRGHDQASAPPAHYSRDKH